jgi:hypothetical protein
MEQVKGNGLPDVRVETIYYIHPIGPLAEAAVAEYLDAAGLTGIEGVVIHYGGGCQKSWRVPVDFFERLSGKRRSYPSAYAFRAFSHPRNDPSAIVECVSKRLLAELGNKLIARLSRQDRHNLGRLIGIHPKASKKRRKR